MKKGVLNVMWLTAVQASNALLPLVVFPVALAAVGDDFYSTLVISEALTVFLLAIVLYSFEIDGVAGVVGLDPGKDGAKISQMLSGVCVTRLLLYVVFLPVLVCIAWVLDEKLIMPVLAWSLVPLSYAIQPGWLFQGLGQNKVVAVTTVVTRVTAMVATIMLVDEPSKYMLVPIAIGISYILGAVYVLGYAYVKLGLGFSWPGRGYLYRNLVNGRFIFFGNVGVTMYRDANVLVLASIGASSSAIAAYSLAEKLVKSIQAGIRPLNLHFLPHALKIAKDNGTTRQSKLRALFRLTLPQLLALVILILSVFALYPWARSNVALVANLQNLEQVVPLLAVMCVGALFGVANFMFGSAGLNAMGERGYMFAAIVVAGIASVATCAIVGNYVGAYGAAIAFVVAEVSLQLVILRKYLSTPQY